jgi:uncharacterized ion transporter superfamily protein YfcC
MEILFVILAVILITFIFVAFLNYVNDKIEDDESKKINTQKLLNDLHQNLTEGKINQKTYDLERENIISGKSINTNSNDSESKVVGDSKLSDKSFIGKTDELLNLKKLLDEKVLTQAEFEIAKEELLNTNQQIDDDNIEEEDQIVEWGSKLLAILFFLSLIGFIWFRVGLWAIFW